MRPNRTTVVVELERKIKEAEENLKHWRGELEYQRRGCHHEWSEAKYAPIVREAYTDPGDPPGTMGVDWRGPCYVPRQETPRWIRVCRLCLQEEATTQTDQHVTHTPRFG